MNPPIILPWRPGMPPHITLEALIERLEARGISGGRSLADEFTSSGQGHLAEALRKARRALRSGDEQKIAGAALQCTALERQGNELGRQYELAQRRSKGGKASAAAKQPKWATKWQRWLKEEAKLLGRPGMTPEQARQTLRRAMTTAGVPRSSIWRFLHRVK
jgi:hypothetical protein